MGSTTSPNDEWIELFNNGDTAADLTGWTLKSTDSTPTIKLVNAIPAHEYFLLERKDDNSVPDTAADLIYGNDGPIWALNDTCEKLELQDSENNLIDSIDCVGTKWLAGDKTTKQTRTMERKSPLAIGDSVDNWQTSENPGGTPKRENSTGYSPQKPEENTGQDTTPIINYILLNELLPDPIGNEHEGEYIELFNNDDTTADISNWELRDENENGQKNPAGFFVPGNTTIPALSYRAFYTGKKIYLNNDGDIVYLYDNKQILKDSIAYSGKVVEGESYNRQNDNTWAWSTTTTPDKENRITTENNSSADSVEDKVYPRHIWINEFFPNPKGKDTENEFIEIYNPGPDEIDLSNWQIDDQENKGSHPYTFPENFIIKKGEYLDLPYFQTKISLNNDSDWVRLLWPNGETIDEIEYSSPPEAESYNKTNNGWHWSTTPTPGEPNIITSTEDKTVYSETEKQTYSRAIWINEFLPNPKGRDEEGEFIELQNRGKEEIDLTGWQIDDCENTGSKPHTFREDTKIKPDTYLTLYYQDTKISLNNNGDCVRLITPSGQVIDEAQYGKSQEGQSYSRQDINDWQWTEATPGKDNEFTQILAIENSKTKNNLSPVTTPKHQTLPKTGPDLSLYSLLFFLFLLIFYCQNFKKEL